MKSVLVTGASRGIGFATADRLAQVGWHVYAGVRSDEDAARLSREIAGELTLLRLDITDAGEVAALHSALPPQLDALVNNAGIAINAPVEAISPENLRRQFEVNVFGTIAVTQAVLPQIRAARGRVLMISSVSGRIATPWSGPYCGSKFALEAVTDALRMEVKPWGIDVVLIEPNATETDMWRDIIDEFDASVDALASDQRSLYAAHTKGLRPTLERMQKLAVSPDAVVACIEHALTAKRPRTRYPVGVASRVQLAMTALTPTPVNDFVVSRMARIPRRR